MGRERAGLSLGQAARMIGITTDELMHIEESDSCYADADQARLCDVYGVNVEWLSGRSERRDYASIDKITGADDLTPHDRDIIAEFAASMPRRESSDQLTELQFRVDIYGAEANATIGTGTGGRKYTSEVSEKLAGTGNEDGDEP